MTLVKAQVPDEPFVQLMAHKYEIQETFENLGPKKVLVDYNGIVYVLTERGLYRDFPGHALSKDKTYRSLADKIPVDISLQEETGILFYLYKDQYLTNGYAGTVYASLHEQYNKILVNKNMDILLLNEEKSSLYQGREKVKELKIPNGTFVNCYVYDGGFYYLTADRIFQLVSDEWKILHKGKDMTSLAFSDSKIYVSTTNGYYAIDHEGMTVQELNASLPVPDIRKLLLTANDELWFATHNGVFRKEGDRFRYFASKRWLDNNDLLDIACDSENNIYLLSKTGLNLIQDANITLYDKAEYFQNCIRKYHLRYGFVCAPRLDVPHDFTSEEIVDHDNDGLWTSFYLGSQVFRYMVTGDVLAKRYVWESFMAYERLLSINQLEGFPSRTFERTGYKVSDLDRWRDSPESGWEWKGTTSSDEYIAYLFVGAIMDLFIAESQEEKQRVADFIDAIMTHIIENGYVFRDLDREPTTWGRWNPEYVNMYPEHVYDRKLNSIHLIAGLQLAYALTKKEIYKQEAFRMMEEHGYFENMLIDMNEIRGDTILYDGHYMGVKWNHSDDEMAFLTYWPLYHYAFNDTLRQHYTDIIHNHWEIESPERNALWNLIEYGTCGHINEEDVLWHLREFNLDQTSYVIKNSHRNDLNFLPDNFRDQKTEILLTPGEQPTHRHNANPFRLDGGSDGTSVLAGDEYLLPYWLARYLNVIK